MIGKKSFDSHKYCDDNGMQRCVLWLNRFQAAHNDDRGEWFVERLATEYGCQAGDGSCVPMRDVQGPAHLGGIWHMGGHE